MRGGTKLTQSLEHQKLKAGRRRKVTVYDTWLVDWRRERVKWEEGHLGPETNQPMSGSILWGFSSREKDLSLTLGPRRTANPEGAVYRGKRDRHQNI
jgi:hypothetical protein